MIVLGDIEKCECGHNILMHYLEENSDEHAGCIIIECGCTKYSGRKAEETAND